MLFRSLPSEPVLVTVPNLAERVQTVKPVAPAGGESVKGFTNISAPGANGNGSARSVGAPEAKRARVH